MEIEIQAVLFHGQKKGRAKLKKQWNDDDRQRHLEQVSIENFTKFLKEKQMAVQIWRNYWWFTVIWADFPLFLSK